MWKVARNSAAKKCIALNACCRRMIASESGAGIVEYCLIVGVISAATLGAMAIVQDEQDDTYDCLSTSIDLGDESIRCNQIGTTVPEE